MNAARRWWLIAGLLLGFAAPAQAHDTWVMPSAFRLPAGKPISTRLSAGNGLLALSAPRRRSFKLLQLIDSAGRNEPDAWKRGGKSAQALFPAPAPGVACLALGTRDKLIEINPDTVDEYLGEVQPPAQVLAAWQAQRARGEPWVERYAKDAKTYLRSGADSTGWPGLSLLGHRLELVMQQDPTRLEVGDSLALQLLFDGQPAADIALRLFAHTAAERVARTDSQGRAAFTLALAGRHLVATTVIALPSAPGEPWSSRFATLGFGVGNG